MNIDNIKKIIKEELTLITEGLSSIEYHYTYINNLVNILKENKFHASSNLGSKADFNKTAGKFYFFSMSRTKGMSGFGHERGSDVAIVLDGNKLNYKYKGNPIDYWNYSTSSKDWDIPNSYYQALLSKELEDRIFIDKPIIDNAIQYIKEIHIFINPKRIDEYPDKNTINILLNYLKEYNIPAYFYTNEKDFQLQNKIKSIDPTTLEFNEIERKYTPREPYYFLEDIGKYVAFNNNENKVKLFDAIDNYYKDKSFPEFPDINFVELIKNKIENGIQELKQYIKSPNGYSNWDSFRHEDKYSSLSAAIHNHRSDTHPLVRFVLQLMTNEMKKNGIKTLKDYMKYKLGFPITVK